MPAALGRLSPTPQGHSLLRAWEVSRPLRLSRALPSFDRVTAPQPPNCAGQGKTPGVSGEPPRPHPSCVLSADAPGRDWGHALEPLPAGVPAGAAPPSAQGPQAPQWSRPDPREWVARRELAGPWRPHWPAFRAPLKAPGGAFPSPPGVMAAAGGGRGAAWSGHRLRRDPRAHFHRPLRSAPPWVPSLAVPRLPGGPPHTHGGSSLPAGVCPARCVCPQAQLGRWLPHPGPRPCPSSRVQARRCRGLVPPHRVMTAPGLLFKKQGKPAHPGSGHSRLQGTSHPAHPSPRPAGAPGQPE